MPSKSAITRRPGRWRSNEERAARQVAHEAAIRDTFASADAYALAAAPDRASASKSDLYEDLDAIQLTAENLRAALEVAHVFDVRAIRDALKVALGELDRAEQRVVRESGLEVQTEA